MVKILKDIKLTLQGLLLSLEKHYSILSVIHILAKRIIDIATKLFLNIILIIVSKFVIFLKFA